MHPRTLVLAVPLFCSFGVSLPYQDFESNAPALPISDDESKWDADSADYSDLFSGEKLQALLPLSTGSGASSFLESLPGLPGVDFAAKPSVPPKAGSTAQQRPAPGKLRSRPTTGDTPSRQSSPGTVPQQPNPATNPGLPWTANPSFGGQLPQELQITPEYGYIGPYFTCTLGNIPGNVNCNSGYQCARCNEDNLFVYYCSSPTFPGYHNKCPAAQGAIDSTDFITIKRQLFADVDIGPPPICQCGKPAGNT